jgi:hypothetical protein
MSCNTPVVRIMIGLALLYMVQKRYEKAEERFIKAIDIWRRELPGKDHPHPFASSAALPPYASSRNATRKQRVYLKWQWRAGS